MGQILKHVDTIFVNRNIYGVVWIDKLLPGQQQLCMAGVGIGAQRNSVYILDVKTLIY